jgi:hypothetical protein
MRRSWIGIVVLLVVVAFSGAFALARDKEGTDPAASSPPVTIEPAASQPAPPDLRPGAPLPGLRSKPRAVVRVRRVEGPSPRRRRRASSASPTSPTAPTPPVSPAPRPAPKAAPKPDSGKKFYDAG